MAVNYGYWNPDQPEDAVEALSKKARTPS